MEAYHLLAEAFKACTWKWRSYMEEETHAFAALLQEAKFYNEYLDIN